MPDSKDEPGDVKLTEAETGGLEAVPVDGTARVYSTSEMAAMKQSGLSYAEIGRVVGLTKQAVAQRVKPYLHRQEEIETFKAAEPDILASKRKAILDSMTETDIKATKSIRDRAVTYGILTDKARLLSGDSTSNIGVSVRWCDVVHQSMAGRMELATGKPGVDVSIDEDAYQARLKEYVRKGISGPTKEVAE